MTVRPLVVAIVGPTASGKTALSLSISERLPAEIVACDSRTIYRYMDIGTAKPSAAERAHIRHHMLDLVDPDEVYTVAQYKEDGTKAIEDILSRGRLPIVVGGTGFYARALLEGLEIPAVEPQPELRTSLRELADTEGRPALHKKLAELDPVSAARIGVNDVFRIIRAIEVSVVCGRPFSDLARRVPPRYDTLWIGLTAANRSILYEAIRRRYHDQMAQGMLAEVEGLINRFGHSQSVMNTVNYRELATYLDGGMTRAEADQLCVRHNCQLARRQLIWFRANPLINWWCVDEIASDELPEAVLRLIENRRN